MPTYDFKCKSCSTEIEEMCLIAEREKPTKTPCEVCGGKMEQVMAAPYFGYDNIHTRHSKGNKEPGWFKDKITDLKRQNPGHSMS
jgi:putative FmdB family regulatory protein